MKLTIEISEEEVKELSDFFIDTVFHERCKNGKYGTRDMLIARTLDSYDLKQKKIQKYAEE